MLLASQGFAAEKLRIKALSLRNNSLANYGIFGIIKLKSFCTIFREFLSWQF
jgi:hypothetical protein